MDIKDVEPSIRQADAYFKVGRLADAKPLYENALVCLENAYTQGHPDVTYCQQRIGDTCYLLGENEEALAALSRVLQMRERQQSGANASDLVINLFKLAKCCERLGRFEDAESLYDRAFAEGTRSLFAGHPLLGAVMEGHAIMLKRQKKDPERAAQLAQQAKQIKDLAGDLSKMPENIAEALRLNTYEEEGELEQIEEQEAKEAEYEVARETLQKLFVKGKKIAIVIVVIIVLGIGVTFGINQMKVASETAAQKEIVRKFAGGEGKEFVSSDHWDRLKFLPDGIVDALIDGVHRKVPFKVVTYNAGFATTEPTQRSYKAVPEGLLADGGNILWKEGAPELAITDRAKAIAAVVQKYYQEKSEYPTDLTELTKDDEKLTTNTISGEKEPVMLMSAGRERDWDPEKPEQTPKTQELLESGKLLDEEPELVPGSIHCYYLTSGDPYVGTAVKGFFMRIVGGKGTFLPGHVSEKVLVVALKNGRSDHIEDVQSREVTDNDPKINSVRVLESQ